MSRGGRGRGRGSRPNFPGLDYDPTLKLDSKPSELFPPYQVPVAAIPTEKEKREVKLYLDLREQFHKAALYTAPQVDAKSTKFYGEDQYNSQFHNRMKPDIDPFEGMPRYSWKYDQEKRAIPQLSSRPFDKSLFPKELWPTLEGEEGRAVRKTINKGLKKRADILAGSNQYKRASSGAASQENNPRSLEKVSLEADDADTEVDREEEDEEIQDEEKDYDYEEDEAEMGGDYLAEQYFDGGEGDEDDGMETAGGDDY